MGSSFELALCLHFGVRNFEFEVGTYVCPSSVVSGLSGDTVEDL